MHHSIPELQYREATSADVPGMERSRAGDPDAGPADERMPAYLEGRHHPQQALALRTAFVALDGPTIAGYIAGHATTRYGCAGEVQYLYVTPAYRRRRVASRLLVSLARWFHARGVARVCVNADIESAGAAAFYTAHGARPLNPYWYVWDDIGTILKADAEELIEDPGGEATRVVLTGQGGVRARHAVQEPLAAPLGPRIQGSAQAAPRPRKPGLSDLQDREARKLLAPLCELRGDPRIKAQVRREFRVEGTAIVLSESRLRFDRPAEWLEHPVAKFRYVKSRRVWELYCVFRDLKWHLYEPLPEAPALAPLVEEVRRDPTGIFWG